MAHGQGVAETIKEGWVSRYERYEGTFFKGEAEGLLQYEGGRYEVEGEMREGIWHGKKTEKDLR